MTDRLASMIAGRPIANPAAPAPTPTKAVEPKWRWLASLFGKTEEQMRELTVGDHLRTFNELVSAAADEARQHGCHPNALAARLEDHAKRLRLEMACLRPV